MKKVKKVKKEIVIIPEDLPATPVKEVISETSEDLGQVGINALARKVNELVRKVNAL